MGSSLCLVASTVVVALPGRTLETSHASQTEQAAGGGEAYHSKQ